MATFGADIIRRFHVNVSSQKRITARDYEDLLQVCRLILLPRGYSNMSNSALFLLLKTCFLHATTRLFSTLSTRLQSGMALLNSVYIPSQHSVSSRLARLNCATSFASSRPLSAKSISLKSCPTKSMPAVAVQLVWQHKGRLLSAPVMARLGMWSSTSLLTNYMPFLITPYTFGLLERQTTSQLKW